MATVTGGDKLMAALRDIDGRLASAGNDPHVKVGFIEQKNYADGMTTPTVAFLNEFGHGNVPPRPFFRRMIKKDGPAWPGEIVKVLKATDYDAARTLGLMGDRIKGQLMQSIVELTSPALADSTIARKAKGGAKVVLDVYGPEKPLIETGEMLRSITYEVSA